MPAEQDDASVLGREGPSSYPTDSASDLGDHRRPTLKLTHLSFSSLTLYPDSLGWVSTGAVASTANSVPITDCKPGGFDRPPGT